MHRHVNCACLPDCVFVCSQVWRVGVPVQNPHCQRHCFDEGLSKASYSALCCLQWIQKQTVDYKDWSDKRLRGEKQKVQQKMERKLNRGTEKVENVLIWRGGVKRTSGGGLHAAGRCGLQKEVGLGAG